MNRNIVTLRQWSWQQSLLSLKGSALFCHGTLLVGGTCLQFVIVSLQFLMGSVELTALMRPIDSIADKAEEEKSEECEKCKLLLAGIRCLLLSELFYLVDDDFLFLSIETFCLVKGIFE